MEIGTKVEWTHVSTGRRTMSMVLREGTVEGIRGEIAIVRTKGRRLIEVPVRRLRTEGQESQISEFVNGIRDAHRNQS